ncbi:MULTISPECIES: MFS transporter [Burkholderiaceae]|uniref:MFS transporter n=1 Tax=Burkholderiaceae TaxID=119060 RepID=UPI00141F6C3E|nr:MFS transporter [Paraburkholderia sp. Ac-20342]NIF53043.1 MFS transporter [Burkholderia sp. Ax-1724]
MQSAPTQAAGLVLTPWQKSQAVAMSCLGWAFDLFDLFILLYVAPILATVFFDSSRQMLSLAAVYGAFTATLIMRPVGGYLFGRYSDRHGRKKTLVVASVGVGVSTALMGTIPTYQSIGILAPMLFLLLRLIQGVYMGGMVAATHTLGTESIGPKYRGLASGIICGGGSGIGKLFASLIFVLVSALIPPAAFTAWGWRIMFFSGLASSLLGLFVFTRLQESPLWLALAAQHRAAPTRPQKKASALSGGFVGITVGCVLLTLAGGGLSYLTSGYLPTFLKIVNHVPHTTMGMILSVSAVCVSLTSVLAGALTDRIGRRRAMLFYGLISLVSIPLLYLGLTHAEGIGAIAVYTIALSSIGTFCYSPLVIVLNERFPTAIRSSGTAISWNVGFAIGGSMPTLVSLLATDVGALPMTLATVSALVSLVYLAVVFLMPETKGAMDESSVPAA